MKRRVFALSGLLLAAALGAGGAAQTQDQPLRILVGFPAGGGTDAIARHLAHDMSLALKRNVVVENRPGAGGQIAANALKAAAPDGHTLFFSNSHALAMIPLTIRNPGYDPLKDFAPVALATISNDVMAVNPKVVGNVGNLAGLIEWVKAHPGKGNIGVPAPLSDPDFGVRLLATEFKTSLTSAPYRGDAPLVQDLVAGHIPAGIGTVGALMPYHKLGQLRIIAVAAPQRMTELPEVQAYVEQGLKGYATSGYTGMLAPAGTPRAIITRYNEVISAIVKSPQFAAKVESLGVIPTASTPEELGSRIQTTTAAFKQVLDRVGFRME